MQNFSCTAASLQLYGPLYGVCIKYNETLVSEMTYNVLSEMLNPTVSTQLNWVVPNKQPLHGGCDRLFFFFSYVCR